MKRTKLLTLTAAAAMGITSLAVPSFAAGTQLYMDDAPTTTAPAPAPAPAPTTPAPDPKAPKTGDNAQPAPADKPAN